MTQVQVHGHAQVQVEQADMDMGSAQWALTGWSWPTQLSLTRYYLKGMYGSGKTWVSPSITQVFCTTGISEV